MLQSIIRTTPASLVFAALLTACYASHTPDESTVRDGGARDGGRRDGGARDAGRRDGGPAVVCDTLTEAECIGSPDCGPIYDDFCCPICLPVGACADCVQPQMYLCGSIGAACADDPPVCGGIGGWTCRGGVADCSMASPAANGRCDVRGCVQAIDPSCADDCPVECVPVTGDSCTAACRLDPPPCPEGMVNEGDGSCYTGRCIPMSACSPAPITGIGP